MHVALPPEGLPPSSSPAETMFRTQWASHLRRGETGAPLLPATFVVEQGRHVRLVDVRDDGELTGPHGHIAGVSWLPFDEVEALAEVLPRHAPVVLISRNGGRAGRAAALLESKGMLLVAALSGGMTAWRDLGFVASRSSEDFSRLRPGVDALGEHQTAPPSKAEKRHLTLEDIRTHVGQSASVRWVKVAAWLLHGKTSCVDGRDDHGVIGTAGGDAGEFLLALATAERLSRQELDQPTVAALLSAWVDAFGHFYMHSDVTASNTLIRSIRADPRIAPTIGGDRPGPWWRQFFRTPPAELREALLEHLLATQHIGCGHLRLMLQDPDSYNVRPGLALAFREAFFRAYWDGQVELEHVVLPGAHAEGAVVQVLLEDEVMPYTRVPLVSPSVGATQFFVAHPQVSAFLRRNAARFVTTWMERHRPALRLERRQADMFQDLMEQLAQIHATATLGRLAAGLPVFQVTFGAAGGIDVREAGHIEG